MADIVANLRKRHTLYVTAVAGILLLIMIGIAVAAMFISLDIQAENTLDDILESFYHDYRPESVGSARCFAFVLQGTTAYYSPAYQTDIEHYGDDVNKIIDLAVQTEHGYFRAVGRQFLVKAVQKNGMTVYAVYDRTADALRTRSVLFICIAIYFFAMGTITILAYLFSAKTTQPLKDAFDMQKDLIANASHELKTPLAIISADLAVMNSEKESSVRDNEKWMDSISGQVDRMNELVKGMLELSKLEQTTIKKDNVDFSSIVESACLEIEALAFEKGATLVSDVQDGLVVLGDKMTLSRLPIILLDNALKYCGDKGKVGCRLRLEGKRVHLEVLNTGAVIGHEEAKHVFDRFYRSDGARQNPDNKSFGLGLAIAKATVNAHGGAITCHGVEGKGTVFDVFLPVARKKKH